MPRIEIEYGSLASSQILNDNFKYLEDSISEFAQVIETNKASLESQISTVNTNVNSKLDDGLADLTEIVNLNSPAGTIMMTLRTSAPTGYLLCQGQAVSRTTYKDLYDAIKTVYGEGDGSTTFNLPNFKNRVPWGSNASNSFGYLSAGLPNITGKFSSQDAKADGAFSIGDRIGGLNGGGVITTYVKFNANNGAKQWNSACANIYGGSTTVQPPAVKVNFIIKY